MSFSFTINSSDNIIFASTTVLFSTHSLVISKSGYSLYVLFLISQHWSCLWSIWMSGVGFIYSFIYKLIYFSMHKYWVFFISQVVYSRNLGFKIGTFFVQMSFLTVLEPEKSKAKVLLYSWRELFHRLLMATFLVCLYRAFPLSLCMQ